MEKVKKERDSNFELLRIIAIFMIILSHFCYYGGILENLVSDKITTNVITTQILYFQRWTINVFIMITGYFMIKSKVNYKKIINLIIEMFFYSIIFMGIFYGFNIVKFDIKEFIKNIFPIFWGNWFIKYYIILYLLIPYLNIFIEKITKEQLQKVIVLLLIIFSIIPTAINNAWGLTFHNIFILDYFIGAYIRLYSIKKLENNNKLNVIALLLIAILSIVFSVACMIVSKILDINILLKIPEALVNSNTSPVQILVALLIFYIFKNIKIKSKLINYIASSVLGVYLIHDNTFVRNWIWNVFLPNASFLYLNTVLFILFIFAKVAIIFLVSLIIDKIRIILFQKLENKISDNIYNILLNFINVFKRKFYNCSSSLSD